MAPKCVARFCELQFNPTLKVPKPPPQFQSLDGMRAWLKDHMNKLAASSNAVERARFYWPKPSPRQQQTGKAEPELPRARKQSLSGSTSSHSSRSVSRSKGEEDATFPGWLRRELQNMISEDDRTRLARSARRKSQVRGSFHLDW